ALLGTVEARLDAGSAVSFGRKKAEALLAYLALHPGQRQPRDKLATLLWGDTSDERARHSLRQALVTLRQALPREAAASLVEEGDTVGVNPATVEVDVALFVRLLGLDPAQEAVHRTLMRLYTRQGRRGAALRQYQACVGVLERELGLEPEVET